jgi:DNA mismatch repair protein MutS2
MGDQARRLEDLILKLQDQIEENEQLKEDLQHQKVILEGLTKQYQEENDRLTREAKRLRRKAAEEASAIVDQANAAVEKAIQTIREKRATRQAIREAKALVREEKEILKREVEAASRDEEYRNGDQIMGEVRVGDRVFWTRGGIVVTVLSNEDATGHVVITSGKLRVRVPKSELASAKGLEKDSPDVHLQIAVPFPDNVRTEIDVRGMQVEEALDAVDKFVNDALLSGLREVSVIHGVGTGTLRNNILPFLEQHPLVETALPGGPNQRNMGATTVKIAGK